MLEKKKIYILTCGVYEEYHIVGVFSTEEKAEEALNLLLLQGKEKKDDCCGTECYELDVAYGEIKC